MRNYLQNALGRKYKQSFFWDEENDYNKVPIYFTDDFTVAGYWVMDSTSSSSYA